MKTYKNRILTCLILFIAMLMPGEGYAQKIVSIHKAQKQETIFGIAKQYGITLDELKNANPAMREDDFVLKKGMMINIPEHIERNVTSVNSSSVQATNTNSKRTITLGVMLPLHNINGDGKRMVEYYRGMLLAINQLKKENYNVTVNAWNLAEGDDAKVVLLDPKAEKCDIIFGPLYTSQVPDLAKFCTSHDIRMVIPFSIRGNDVDTCPKIFQVYQSPEDITAMTIDQFVAHFSSYYPVFIDCNDVNSKKGNFTFGLRKVLDEKGIAYSITNLNNSSALFAQAFSHKKKNIVVLNTGRSPELGQAFKKLEELKETDSSLSISMFGYNEWFMYTSIYDQRFRHFDTYIPSTYDYNPSSPRIQSIEKLYLNYYKEEVQKALPRFALTGYDQTMFFVRGFEKHGKSFVGSSSQSSYTPAQTPLEFKKQGTGGYKNTSFMLVHYK